MRRVRDSVTFAKYFVRASTPKYQATRPRHFRQALRCASSCIPEALFESLISVKQYPHKALLCKDLFYAESEGFEPSREFPPYALSKGALSATQPTLQYTRFARIVALTGRRLRACRSESLLSRKAKQFAFLPLSQLSNILALLELSPLRDVGFVPAVRRVSSREKQSSLLFSHSANSPIYSLCSSKDILSYFLKYARIYTL